MPAQERRRQWAVRGRLVTPEAVVEDGVLAIAEDRIAWVGPAGLYTGPAPLQVPPSCLVTPGFIDLHVHGGGGGSLCMPDAESMRRALRFHAAHGTVGLLATFRTAPLTEMAETLAVVKAVQAEQARSVCGADLLGVHLEGPWLNPKMAGGQVAELMRPPSAAEFDALADLGPVRWATVAPELEGAEALIRRMRERHVRVAAGHTAARYDEMAAAARWGLDHCSHFYNAMCALHHREPGTVGAGLTIPELHLEIIADGIHVHPVAIQLAYAAKGWRGISLVTDAVEFAGLPEGLYRRGTRLLRVGSAITLENGTLAGSGLTMNRAVGFLVDRVGIPVSEAVAMASMVPAGRLGLGQRGALAPGYSADFAVLTSTWEVTMTVIRGQVAYEQALTD